MGRPKGAAGHSQWITVLLSCNHELEFPATHMPHPGELLWCRHHNEYMECSVIKDYRVRCQQCAFSRSFGAAEITAKTSATVHALRRMHKVIVTRAGETVETIDPKPAQTQLDHPPF